MATGNPETTSAPEGHQPYVADEVTTMPEFTVPAVLMGAVLGIIFGASSLYLVLKVGMTVSASIPVAVLSITLFRALSRTFGLRRTTILENNIVQTTGSAGESIAFGVGVTMPALMLLGFEMNVGRVLVVASLGGLLGILMMIPLRRAFIVKKHKELAYPEGTACADVLIVGEKGGSSARTVFVGFGIAFFYQFLWQGLRLFKEVPEKSLRFFKGATPGIEVNPALLGVGYIIGTRISFVMAAGGVLASFVLIPAIRLFGSQVPGAIYPGKVPISQMTDFDIWKQYVLYIGAGAVAAGGIISLCQALPLILSSIQSGIRDLRASGTGLTTVRRRTDNDLPIWLVGAGSIFLVLAIWGTTYLHQIIPAVPDLNMNPIGAILIVLFGFLFVTVSSRLTGEIGSSSNPISGMTVATLLITCLIFLAMGWTSPAYRLTALSVAAVVCIAASNGGTTSQDLKTGYLVGGTPKWQQWGILIGSLSSALVIGVVLIVLNQAGTVYTNNKKHLPTLADGKKIDVSVLTEKEKAPNDPKDYHVLRVGEGNEYGISPGQYLVNEEGEIKYLKDPGINGTVNQRDDGTEVQKYNAPKASLMALITDGILNQKLPWTLVLIGVSIAIVLEFCGVPSLPFAVGVYLPLSASTPILCGGLARYAVDKYKDRGKEEPPDQTEEANTAEAEDMSPGVLTATGYIAGGAIAGVLIAFLSFSDTIPKKLSVWQYRTWTVPEEKSLDDLAGQLAASEVGTESPQNFAEMTEEIKGLNGNLLTQYIPIDPGKSIQLPQGQTYTAQDRVYLRDIANEKLGSPDKAQLLLNLNDDLTPAETLPAGAELRIPQKNWPALVAFAILFLILISVGCGWMLRDPPARNGNATAQKQ